MPLGEGVAVFPLYRIERNTKGEPLCGCGSDTCKTIGKHPAYPYGSLEKGQEVGGPPGCGYGIATGSRSDLFVVDLDSEEAIATFEAMGEIPETFTVATGRGAHLYFQQPAFPVKTVGGRVGGLWPPKGIDIRGEGGYVVAPGSPHKSGKTYEVLVDAPIAPAPAWLLERLERAEISKRGAGMNAPTPIDLESDEGQRRLGLAREFLATAAPAIDGERGGSALLRVCIHLVRRLELPLAECATLIGDLYNDRCDPPWSESEIWHKLEDARDKSEIVPGLAPEGWDLSAAAQRPVRVPVQVTRKKHDPSHVYSFAPGDVPNGEKTKRTFGNVVADLTTHPAWEGVWQFNEFNRKVYAVDPPLRLDAEAGDLSDKDADKIVNWFETESQYVVGREAAFRASVLAADRNKYHPIKEYLASCAWDGVSKIPGLACALGTEGALSESFLRKTMIAAVRRILRPGCQVDTVLVLCGGQGAKKTSFVRALFGEEWTRSQIPDLASKDASEALNGFWALELAELDKILRAETSTVKEFITRTFDDYRPPYGRASVRFPRSSVLVGTTNERGFLRDSTGDRRFWPLLVADKIDLAWVIAHRDGLWAEAVALEAAGIEHWFDEEQALDAARADFVQNDPWHDTIRDFLCGREAVRSAEEVYLAAIAKGDATAMTKLDKQQRNRVADTLRRLGCRTTVKRVGEGTERYWSVPDNIRDAKPSENELIRRRVELFSEKTRNMSKN